MHLPAAKTSAAHTTARTYPGSTDRLRAVRSDLRDLLVGCPSADDVILCASELATNAVLHSRSGVPGGTFAVRVTVIPGSFVRIDVEDDGGPWTLAITEPASHHGFDIVGTLAAERAIVGDHSGRTASAVLDWTPQAE